jgi:hypothetical protein
LGFTLVIQKEFKIRFPADILPLRTIQLIECRFILHVINLLFSCIEFSISQFWRTHRQAGIEQVPDDRRLRGGKPD